MKKTLLVPALVAALALSAVAAASSSPAAYRAQVNGICAKGVKQLNAIPKPATPSGYYAYFRKAVAMSDALLARVESVKPPASLSGPVATAVARQGAFEKALHTLMNKLKTSSNPQKTLTAAGPKLDSLNGKANKAWRAAGLLKCAG